jgi:transposase
MFSSPFLPLPSGLEIATTEAIDDLLKVEVISIRNSSCCPLCFQPATRIHSHYRRVVADVPCGGLQVQLVLHLRKFFCETPECPRKIFTERVRRCALIPLVGGVQHHWSKHG